MEKQMFSAEINNNIASIKLRGGIFSPHVSNLERTLACMAKNTNKVVFDAAGLDYICSAALGTIADFGNRLSLSGGGIVIFGLSKKMDYIFQTTGFASLVKIEDNYNTAIQCLISTFEA